MKLLNVLKKITSRSRTVMKNEGVQKGHFTLFFRKIALDYKRITNEESLEKRLFGHPPALLFNSSLKSIH
jgi:hypothetical protein